MAQLENLYREVIMEHYKHPRNKGLTGSLDSVKSRIKNPSCGDDITVESIVENGIVTSVRHDGHGCSICCASASIMSEIMEAKPVEWARSFANNYLHMVSNQPYDESIDFGEAAAFSGIRMFPARIKCASIAWQAFLETIK